MGIFKRKDVDELAERGDTKGLLKALRGRDPVVQARAALLLGSIGKPAVPVLIEALKDDDRDVRTSAAGALISIGPDAKSAVSTLVRALKDEDHFVRWNAAAALGEIGDKSAAYALAELLEDEEAEVRKTALSALRKMIGEGEGAGLQR